jgi:uncharacterized protein
MLALLPALLLSLALDTPVRAEAPFPSPRGAVNDFAGVIPPSYRDAMERLAGEVLAKTGAALVVATVASTEGRDPDEYANQLFESWGIGKKGEDRGVLLFLAVKERRVRIETGYGLEGVLPDGLAGSILDRYVLPDLRKGEYGPGLLNGMKAVAAVVAGEGGRVSAPAERPLEKRGGSLARSLFLFFVLFLLLGTRRGRAMLPYILLMMLSGGGGGSRRGGFGGFGGGFGGFGGGMSGGGGAGRSF